MGFLAEYQNAVHDAEVARLRRILALRAMVVSGMSQRQIAEQLGVSQSAISQQLGAQAAIGLAHPGLLLEAATPVLKEMAAEQGYARLAVFGSVARGDARDDSDIDLLAEAPPGTSSLAFVDFKQKLERVLGRGIDLVPYGGLQIELDADIQRDAVLL